MSPKWFVPSPVSTFVQGEGLQGLDNQFSWAGENLTWKLFLCSTITVCFLDLSFGTDACISAEQLVVL